MSTTTFNSISKKISNILVAIDGSEHSFKAAEFATDLAKFYNANLFAITVTYIPKSHNISQKEIISKSLTEDNIDNNAVKNAEDWFEGFVSHAKENNIQLKTE